MKKTLKPFCPQILQLLAYFSRRVGGGGGGGGGVDSGHAGSLVNNNNNNNHSSQEHSTTILACPLGVGCDRSNLIHCVVGEPPHPSWPDEDRQLGADTQTDTPALDLNTLRVD